MRMHDEANRRLYDADILSGSLANKSDSGEIIRVLAFEVLLKCVAYISTAVSPKSHRYFEIWRSLPGAARERILILARERIGPYADYGDINRQEALLKDFQFVFEQARYYYELYESATIREQTREGEYWIARGGNLDEAKVRYHPHEMTGLLHGLNGSIDAWLSAASS